MNGAWILMATGLLVGTYLVRAIPFWLPDLSGLPPAVRRFLGMVPPAALGALIIPDAFASVPIPVAVGVVGLSVGLTLRGVQLTVVVGVAILVTWGAIVLGA